MLFQVAEFAPEFASEKLALFVAVGLLLSLVFQIALKLNAIAAFNESLLSTLVKLEWNFCDLSGPTSSQFQKIDKTLKFIEGRMDKAGVCYGDLKRHMLQNIRADQFSEIWQVLQHCLHTGEQVFSKDWLATSLRQLAFMCQEFVGHKIKGLPIKSVAEESEFQQFWTAKFTSLLKQALHVAIEQVRPKLASASSLLIEIAKQNESSMEHWVDFKSTVIDRLSNTSALPGKLASQLSDKVHFWMSYQLEQGVMTPEEVLQLEQWNFKALQAVQFAITAKVYDWNLELEEQFTKDEIAEFLDLKGEDYKLAYIKKQVCVA